MPWVVFYVFCAVFGIANAHDVYLYYKKFPFGNRNTVDDLQLLVLHHLHIIDLGQKYNDGVLKQKTFQRWVEFMGLNVD